MTRAVLAVAAFVAVGAIMAAPGTPSSKVGRQLEGTVGPGFTITLHDENGETVTSLRPGVYWLTVHDRSAIHNFHIFGGGIDEHVTSVPFVGDATVKIRVGHGTVTFQCDPHAGSMHGTFTVGGVGQD